MAKKANYGKTLPIRDTNITLATKLFKGDIHTYEKGTETPLTDKRYVDVLYTHGVVDIKQEIWS